MKRFLLRAIFLIVGLILVAALASSVSYRLSPPPDPQTNPTTYLPFDLSDTNSPRKVFAHYVPHFPISIDNKNGDEDYYATQYLPVNGEGGIHTAYGGLLRDRPIPRATSPRADWKLVDLLTEMSQAKSVGIDGFAVDVIDPHATSDVVDRLLQAAALAGTFTIMITADMAGPLGTLSAPNFAAEIAAYLTQPSAFHLSDGRAALGAFAAERQAPAWWQNVLSILRDRYQLSVAFVPTFLDVAENPETFATFSYGFSMWGGRNPNAMVLDDAGPGSPVGIIRRTHQLGKLWMQPVAFQDSRPRSGIFEESANGLTNRMAWQIAEQQNAEWVQLISWNDYAESTAMAPSVVHGWRILDLNAYDIASFKRGRAPRIVRDALFVSYRIQPASARPVYPETLLMSVAPSSAPPRDAIEVVTFAVAPSELLVRAGTYEYRCAVPKGRGVCTFPLSLGSISAELSRHGEIVASARSDVDVTDLPRVQDLQYRVVGGLR